MKDMKNNSSGGVSSHRNIPSLVFGVILCLLSIPLLAGGGYLCWLGGSVYYLLSGLLLGISAYGFMKNSSLGVKAFFILTLMTIIWAFYESGLRFWPMVPRLSWILLLLIPVCLLAPGMNVFWHKKTWRTLAAISAVVLVSGLVAMFYPHDEINTGVNASLPVVPVQEKKNNWQYYGRTPAGTRFAPFNQITVDNVSSLKVAWTFRTGEIAGIGSENQNTPVQVGDSLYVCTPLNKVFAIDANSGKEIWQFDAKIENYQVWNRCRGVSYYNASETRDAFATVNATTMECPERVIMSTLDARLIALDAKTGQLCKNFGNGGQVNLQQGMGEVKPTFYMGTSPVLVAGNLLIVGGWVYDNLSTNEPSGVIRAFNAVTGELEWAWDLGNPAISKYPPAGGTYTRGTPNMWSSAAYDARLGLIYIPLGNSTPDYWGGHRSDASNKYGSSIVALDYRTGRERWAYQTVHHDIWDYDLPAQPALYDFKDDEGKPIKGLIQATKTGNIFLLDRVTGKPLTRVEERAVPQQELSGDKTAQTQPFSSGMPYIGQERLDEKDMWGLTPFDQMLCRIQFKSLKYDGPFTPPGVRESLQHPGNFGGMNWGSVAINEDTGTMVVNDIRIPLRIQLIPREHLTIKAPNKPHSEFAPQYGTPYAVKNSSFMSVLGVPCQAPPYGTITAIDLHTKKIIWQKPAGTLRDTVMAGFRVKLPIPIGMPTLGGPLITRSGLVFFAGTQDYYLRAFNQQTGEELWKGRLPVGAQATPMTFVSPTTHKQYIVVSAGGARSSPERGDYLVAYALPEK